MHLDAADNLAAMEQQLANLLRMFPWVEMVLFSELAPFGGARKFAAPLPSATEEHFQALAARHQVWLIPGTFHERADDTLYNTASVINPRGEIVARYRKMFPFYPYEHRVAPGDEFCVFDVPAVGKFGVCICYDMWFPETVRSLTALGAEVILHPVMTTTIDREIEVAIAQATGALFQTFVFDINGLGAGGNGRSCVVDPHGRFLHQAAANPEWIPLQIDLDVAQQARENGVRGLGQTLKSFRDRRVQFPVYEKNHPANAYLDSLGALEKPKRKS